MNILITNCTCIQDIIGGASRAMDEVARLLSSSGHNVTVLVPDRNKTKKRIEYINQNYKILRYRRFGSILFFLNFFSVRHCLSRFNNYKFDIVWGNSPEPWIYLNRKDILSIYTFHGPWKLESVYNNNINKFKEICINFIYWRILSNVYKIHFQTNYVFNECQKETFINLSKYNRLVTPVLINEKKLEMPSNSFCSNYIINDKLNVLVARRLVKRTGVLEFLAQIENFDTKIKSALNIIIVGVGDLSIKVENKCRNSTFATFIGSLEQQDLDYLYSNVDVVCMPSIDAEGFGVSVLEALLRNTPVVYTNGGGMAEFLLDKFPDFAYEKTDHKALSNIFYSLYQNKQKNKSVLPINIGYDFEKNLYELFK